MIWYLVHEGALPLDLVLGVYWLLLVAFVVAMLLLTDHD
jgi:hypothetical protein